MKNGVQYKNDKKQWDNRNVKKTPVIPAITTITHTTTSVSCSSHSSSNTCLSVVGTNLWAYLAFIEATHACSQTQFVFLGARPLSTHVDDRYGDHSEQNNAAERHANRHAYLLPLTTSHQHSHHLLISFISRSWIFKSISAAEIHNLQPAIMMTVTTMNYTVTTNS